MDYVHPLDTEHRKLSDRDKLFLDVRLAADRLSGQLLDGSITTGDLSPGMVLPEEMTYGASIVTIEFVGENEIGLSAQFEDSTRLKFKDWSEMKELLDTRAHELSDRVQLEHLIYEPDPYGRVNWWGYGSAYNQEQEEKQSAEAWERQKTLSKRPPDN